MKTSRTNSFRLHRLGNNSARKYTTSFYDPNETVRTAALNSIHRGVKHAEISYLTGLNLNKLRVEPLEINEGEYTSAHLNLTEIRRKYDQIRKERVALEEKIDHLKSEKQKYGEIKDVYQGQDKQALSKKDYMESKRKELQERIMECNMEKKVLLNMKQRYKADKIFYDQRKFDLSKELEFLNKQLVIYNEEGLEIGESSDRTLKVYDKLEKELESERRERETHLANLEAMIGEKLRVIESNEDREARLEQIAERAIQDKDLNEKNWRKIFLTHTFVNKMLRLKIEREMQKFSVVEMAFKEIKTATGVSDAKTLVSKYLNKQNVYGEYLSKISDNEKVIERLKNETEDLVREEKALSMEMEDLQSAKIKKQDLHQYIKQIEFYDQAATIANKFENKLGQWLRRQLKKLAAINKAGTDYESPKTKKELLSCWRSYLQSLIAELNNAKEVGISDQLQIEGSSKNNQKVVRIQPKRARKNSIGEDVFDVDEEETNPNSQVEEEDLINNQREDIIRSNERFMRQIRRKREEEKKQLLDKHESKKIAKVPQPKKQED